MQRLAALLLLTASFPALAEQEKPAPAGFDLLPAFVAVCMDHGPDADKIKAALEAMGAQAGPAQPGKSADDPARLTGYIVRSGNVAFSAMFNRVGACSVMAKSVDVAKTKATFDAWVASAKGVFDVGGGSAAPRASGETVVASYELVPKNSAYRMTVSLSTAAREGEAPVTFITRYIAVAPKPAN